MIVQACINGARRSGYHPSLPLTTEAMVRDSIACIDAGAAELHIHPRNLDGRESLSAVNELIVAIRRACPGTLVGVSTGAWIEGDEALTRDRISAWKELPDYASVNFSEPDAPAVMALLGGIGVGVEAGLASIADAKRFVALPDHHRVFRVLIEIAEQSLSEADGLADGIAQTLSAAGVTAPILLHGFDATIWHFVKRARQMRWSTRVGLEDGCLRPQGGVADTNAEMVTDAVKIFRDSSW
ncbi:3-keto-5-aminohexanoate cleavage protein [Rhizobium sp. 2YAF20]|uniref:3-keto-5-aminohexanoate cleavage protein n=1 Tax=Rhizobium sp. 2YAF20 TaxID=3233027 RepID=UPI003F984730